MPHNHGRPLTGALLLVLGASLATAGAQAKPLARPDAQAEMQAIAGTWINPKGSVAVHASNCGARLCGWVSWASPTALNDAAEAGVPRLVGTELLQDYRPGTGGRWSGRVYVPDMGRSFQSTIEPVDAEHLKISGCILGGLFCRSQIWRRG